MSAEPGTFYAAWFHMKSRSADCIGPAANVSQKIVWAEQGSTSLDASQRLSGLNICLELCIVSAL